MTESLNLVEFAKRVAQLEARAREEELEKARTQLVGVAAQVFEKGAAYNNLIIAAGYAGAFGIWAFAKDQLSPTASAWIALLLTFSLAFFIAFNVFQMVITSFQFLRERRTLLADVKSAQELLAAVDSLNKKSAQTTLWIQPLWIASLTLSVLSATGAYMLLGYNFLAALFSLPVWP